MRVVAAAAPLVVSAPAGVLTTRVPPRWPEGGDPVDKMIHSRLFGGNHVD